MSEFAHTLGDVLLCLPAPIPFLVLLSLTLEQKSISSPGLVWLVTLPQGPPELDLWSEVWTHQEFLLGTIQRAGHLSSPFSLLSRKEGCSFLASTTELPPSTSIPPPLAAFHCDCQVTMTIRFPWLLKRAAAFPQAAPDQKRKGDHYCP